MYTADVSWDRQRKTASFSSLLVHAGIYRLDVLTIPTSLSSAYAIAGINTMLYTNTKKYVLFYIKLGQDFISPNLKVMH